MALRNYAATNSSYAATANSEAATKNTIAATATTTYTSMQVNGCDCSYPGCRHSGGYQGVGGIPDGHCAICGVGWNNQGMTVQVPHTTYSCPSGKILSGTKCISYSCSNGTLSGTTCEF